MQTLKNEDPDQTAHIFTGRDETELRFFTVIMKIKSNRLQGVKQGVKFNALISRDSFLCENVL